VPFKFNLRRYTEDPAQTANYLKYNPFLPDVNNEKAGLALFTHVIILNSQNTVQLLTLTASMFQRNQSLTPGSE
jgi:hypothetical protein